jgi:hypothetical protein
LSVGSLCSGCMLLSARKLSTFNFRSSLLIITMALALSAFTVVRLLFLRVFFN